MAEPAAVEPEPEEAVVSEAEIPESEEAAEPLHTPGHQALDLDAIMNAAATTDETGPAPVVSEPSAEEKGDGGPPDSELEEAPEAAEQAVEEEELVPEAEEGEKEQETMVEPVESEQAVGEGEETRAAVAAEESPTLPEQEQPAESPQETDTRPEGEETPAPDEEKALSLDEKLEISLDSDQMGNSSQVLSVNQTIDAIKKKTVKCPVCGTMNYAIRWYCEKCEATLTAL